MIVYAIYFDWLALMKKQRSHLKTSLPATAYSGVIQSVRKTLGQTQEELAVALGISAKAIQSYEQGWRDVPIRVVVQIFTLLAIHRQGDEPQPPCWEITQCPEKERNACPSHVIGHGQCCWFIAARTCHASRNNTGVQWPCATCPVIFELLNRKPGTSKRPPRK